jgi:hypothetical protein
MTPLTLHMKLNARETAGGSWPAGAAVLSAPPGRRRCADSDGLPFAVFGRSYGPASRRLDTC